MKKGILATILCTSMFLGMGASAAETVDLTMTAGLTPDHIITTMGNEIVEKVAEATDGTVNIKFYPADTMGASGDRAQMLMAGDIDIDIQALSVFDAYNPRQGILSAFFMFESWDHYRTFTETELYDEIIDGLEEAINVTCLGDVYYATRHFLTKSEITSLADVKGMKFRVPNEEQPIAGITAIGAAPTPMSGSEVYTALQNGTIEATENGAEQIVSQAFYEVAPYMTKTAHQYQTMCFLMSDAGKEKLSDEQFAAVQQVMDEIIEKYDVLAMEADAENEELLAEKITVNEIDLTEFQAVLEDTYEKYDEVWGDGTWEKIKALAK